MLENINGIQFAALAMKRAKLKKCLAYDMPLIRHICERLSEHKIDVRMFDGIDRISSVLSMCESEKTSACFFIPQKYIALMEEARRFKNRKNRVFIIICDEEGKSTVEIIKALKLPVWIAAKPSDIYSMIIDAAVYSRENNEATAVMVAVPMLFANEALDIYSLDKIETRYSAVSGRFRTLYGSGSTVIVTCGNATEQVLKMTEKVENIRVVALRALLFRRWNFPEKTIYIMPAFNTITSDEQSIREILDKSLSIDQRKQLISQKRKIEVIRERDYYFKENAAMCPGCIFRIKQSEYIENLKEEKIAVAEEIFCTKMITPVMSGIARSNVIRCNSLAELEMYYEDHPDIRAVFFTNSKIRAADGIEVVKLEKEGHIRRGGEMRLINTKCDGCGECIGSTGCPALKLRGFNLNLSAKSCSGCTLCVGLCRRKALYPVEKTGRFQMY